MTDDDIKLAGELAKAAADSTLEPIKEQVTNVFSPFTKEIGLLLALPAQLWRLKAKVIIAEKAVKFLNERGVKPQRVPIKLLSPIMDYGCLEDDESMTDRWATLLASASDPNYKQPILPSFPAILRELSPVEASILDQVYGTIIMNEGGEVAGENLTDNGSATITKEELLGSRIYIGESFSHLTFDESSRLLLFQNLTRLGLLRLITNLDFHPTDLGYAFVSACFVRKKVLPPLIVYTGWRRLRFGIKDKPVADEGKIVEIGGTKVRDLGAPRPQSP